MVIFFLFPYTHTHLHKQTNANLQQAAHLAIFSQQYIDVNIQSLAVKAGASWQEVHSNAMSEAALVLGLQAWERLLATYPKTELPYEDAFRLFVHRAELASNQNAQDVALTCIRTAKEYLANLPSSQVGSFLFGQYLKQNKVL